MAQTGYTPILIYGSTTTTNAPLAANLTTSSSGVEIAVNAADGKLFYKDTGGVVQVLATKGTGTIGGSTTQVQYNNAGALAGSANLTFNGTTLTANTLNLTNALTTTYGGTGLTSFTAGDLPYYATGTALSKLGIGTNGQILTSSGTAPQWSTLSGVAVTTFSAGTTGFTPSTATAGAITLSGTLNAANGGTGQSSYAVGDLLYASGTTALSKLADVATGNALISGGVGVAPSYGKIGLTTHVSGTLPTANGGTNLTSFTANGVMYASSSSVLTTGSALTFDGQYVSIGAGASNPNGIKFLANGGGLAANLTVNHSTGEIQNFGTTNYFQTWYANNSEQMRLTSTGLGIGTSSPVSKLSVTQTLQGNDVSTGAELLMTTSTATNDRLNLNFSMNGVGGRARAAIGAVALDATGGYNCGLAFYTRNANDGSALATTDERARINSSGAWSFGATGTNTGTSGQLLTSQGSGAPPTWTTVSAGGSPGGSTTQVQFNNAGAFGGSSLFTWDGASITVNSVKIGRGANGLITNLVIGYDAGTLMSGANGSSLLIGNSAGRIMSTGYNNTGVGASALYQLTTALECTAVGAAALGSIKSTNNNWNIGFGAGAGSELTSTIGIGRQNTFLGNYCGLFQAGSDNCIIGYNAGANMGANFYGTNVPQDGNTIIGSIALLNQLNTTTNCTFIGYNANTGWNTTVSNSTTLGYAAVITGSNQVQLGNSSTTTYVYGTVQNRSDARDKTDIRDTQLGLDFIQALRPVDFKWDMREDYIEYEVREPAEDGSLSKEPLKETRHEKDGSRKRNRYHHGLIAQEVKAVLDAKGIDFGGYQDHSIAGGKDVLSIGYDELVGPLIKAIQEQQALIAQLTARIEVLEAK